MKNEQFSENFRFLLERNYHLKKALINAAGISNKTFTRYLDRFYVCAPAPENVYRICEFIRIPVDYLFYADFQLVYPYLGHESQTTFKGIYFLNSLNVINFNNVIISMLIVDGSHCYLIDDKVTTYEKIKEIIDDFKKNFFDKPQTKKENFIKRIHSLDISRFLLGTVSYNNRGVPEEIKFNKFSLSIKFNVFNDSAISYKTEKMMVVSGAVISKNILPKDQIITRLSTETNKPKIIMLKDDSFEH